MKWIRFTVLVALLVAGALIAFGSPGSAERDQASEAPESGEEQPLETFIPTDRLPADSAISFPVDI
ncbi:MAG: hypothetical protein GWO83_00945 [Bacteroidia bacterium]|nr:hypothetical protein [Bacteroidia bacterium]